jgi:methylenetetrahydrofolate reductase (NADPH)
MHFLRLRQDVADDATSDGRCDLIASASIEVTPRTAVKVDTFRGLLPLGRRAYIAHIEGVPVDEMVATARRITEAGLVAMPHITARTLGGEYELESLLRRYSREAGVTDALVIAGGASRCAGPYRESMDLVKTGLFDKFGFSTLHFAAHPEGNPAIGEQQLRDALEIKQAYSTTASVDIALVTQFMFDSAKLITWLQQLSATGIDLPVHVGIPGPTNPAALLKYATACGVGPSLQMLQRQTGKVLGLIKPYSPEQFVASLDEARASTPNLAGCHVFPFGGIEKTAEWMRSHAEA